MKFFTVDKIRMLGISGYLSYHEDEQSLNRAKENFKSIGKDYDAVEKLNFIHYKPLMLEYLPDSLKSAANDESIIPSKISSRNLLSEIDKWKLSVKNTQEETFRQYEEHYKFIEKFLLKNVIELNKQYNFHDTKLLAAKNFVGNILEIDLQCSEGFMDEGLYTLIFNGVKLIEMSDDFIGSWWIYSEIHLSDAEDSSTFNEMKITADGVLVKSKKYQFNYMANSIEEFIRVIKYV